jgi:hypothetical protein
MDFLPGNRNWWILQVGLKNSIESIRTAEGWMKPMQKRTLQVPNDGFSLTSINYPFRIKGELSIRIFLFNSFHL